MIDGQSIRIFELRELLLVPNGVLSTTDDDSLFTSKSSTAGNLILDGALKSSKALNSIVTYIVQVMKQSNTLL